MNRNDLQTRARDSRTVVDRVVGYFNPQKGLERMRARMMLSTSVGGYDGGKRDRRGTKRWRPLEGSADADTLPDLPDLRARSRDLSRNIPIATGAIATTVTNVVGDGIQMKSAVDAEFLGLTSEQAEAWQTAAEREWLHFCQRADFASVQPLEEMQSLVFRAALESGDVCVIRRYRKDPGDLYGTKLQILEADRLCNPNRQGDSDTIAGGVEFEQESGRPAAYHFADRHPGGLRTAGINWQRVPARSKEGKQVVLHLFDRLRPEQTRGIPYLAPVIESLKMLGTYSEAEVHAAVVSAMFTVAIEAPADDGDAPIGERDASLEENEIKLGTGAVISTNPGEKVVQINPMRPNEKFDPFVLAVLRQVGVALELPFEILIKHFTASYSASRAALEMAWQFFRRRRTWLSRRFLQVVYEWMLEEAVATGRLYAPGFFSDPLIAAAYSGADWIGPQRASLDPKKESDADKQDIELGVKTRDQVCMQRTGSDFETVTRQLGRERRRREAEGLFDPVPGAASPAATVDAVDPADQTDNADGAAA